MGQILVVQEVNRGGFTASASSVRLGHIDSMRALAALLVVTHHTFNDAAAYAPVSTLIGAISAVNTFVDFGRFGVDLFFIISGYVIPFSLLGRTGRVVPAFLVSRAFRLYPMYWVALGAYLLVMLGPTDGRAIALNATLLHRFVGVTDLIGLSWTLQVELVFYALSAVLFIIGFLSRPKIIVALFCIISFYLLATAVVSLAGGPLLPFGWPTFIALMVGGTLLRFIDDGKLPGGALAALAVAAFIMIKFAVAVLVFADPSRSSNLWTQHFNPVFAAVVTFLLMNGRFRLNWRPAAWVGTISYSVYLLHPLIATLVLPVAGALVGQTSGFIIFLILLISILAVSSATYLLVERPCIRFSHRLACRLTTRQGADS